MEITNKMVFQEIKKNDNNVFIPKGEYIVWVEYNDDNTKTVFSTDSLFWASFFTVE
jgi:hypothetical protein